MTKQFRRVNGGKITRHADELESGYFANAAGVVIALDIAPEGTVEREQQDERVARGDIYRVDESAVIEEVECYHVHSDTDPDAVGTAIRLRLRTAADSKPANELEIGYFVGSGGAITKLDIPPIGTPARDRLEAQIESRQLRPIDANDVVETVEQFHSGGQMHESVKLTLKPAQPALTTARRGTKTARKRK